MFGTKTDFNDSIDKSLFRIDHNTVITPGWTPWSTYEEVNIGDNEGHEMNIKMLYGDKRLDYFQKAVDEGYTLEKALNITGFSAQLIPIYVDPSIIDITRKTAPLVEIIPRVATRGKSVDFNRLTAMGSTGFQAEDAALSEVNDTYVRKAINVGFLYGVGRITGPMQAAAAEYVDANNLEVMNKTKNLRLIEEQAIILGNASTGTSGNIGDGSTDSPWNSAAYPGLIAQQEGLTTAAGITNPWLTSTNIVDAGGANLSLGHIRSAIEEAVNDGGRPKILVTDITTGRQIKGLMNEHQRMVNTQDFFWGINTISIDGIPLIESTLMPRTSRAKRILVLDTDAIEMRVLQDIVYERLAKTNDSDKFYLKIYEVLINKAPEFCAEVQDYL